MRLVGRPRTVRGRLVIVVSGIVVVVLAALASVSVGILRQNLVGQVESTLYLSHSAALTTIEDRLDSGQPLPAFDDFAIAVPPDGYLLVTEGTRPRLSVFFTPTYSYRELTAREIGELTTSARVPDETSTIHLEGKGDYLVTESKLTQADGTSFTVLTGVGLTETDEVVTEYVLWLSAAAVFVGILAAVLGYRLVKRELDPLERIAQVAQEVSATPLSSGEIAPQARVGRDPRREGSEIDRVAGGLNGLLDHVEAALNARHRAEDSMRRFIAEASHELRNPLASIRGYADFYAQPGADAQETIGAFARIGSEAKRMSELVDDLLLLARLDADPEIVTEEVDLSQVVLETVSDARFAYPDHVWRIALPDEVVTIQADEAGLRQILLNLISNAGHHTPVGTEVRVSVETTADDIVLAVTDEGPGIPKAALPTIFDRFTQAGENAGTRTNSTVGLGLAIVRALADASGYRVEVESDAAGTCFTVRMPRTVPDGS